MRRGAAGALVGVDHPGNGQFSGQIDIVDVTVIDDETLDRGQFAAFGAIAEAPVGAALGVVTKVEVRLVELEQRHHHMAGEQRQKLRFHDQFFDFSHVAVAGPAWLADLQAADGNAGRHGQEMDLEVAVDPYPPPGRIRGEAGHRAPDPVPVEHREEQYDGGGKDGERQAQPAYRALLGCRSVFRSGKVGMGGGGHWMGPGKPWKSTARRIRSNGAVAPTVSVSADWPRGPSAAW